jgi:hypothetical protein
LNGNRIDTLTVADEPPRGSICVPVAYAQGKMLSHRGWAFPNGRTLSDIDAVLDYRGWVLFIELHRSHWPIGWQDIGTGQRWLYESICRGSDMFAVVLARHDVARIDVEIDSKNDILDAVVRFRKLTASAKLTGDEYRQLVEAWGSNPVGALAWLDTIAAAQREATA